MRGPFWPIGLIAAAAVLLAACGGAAAPTSSASAPPTSPAASSSAKSVQPSAAASESASMNASSGAGSASANAVGSPKSAPGAQSTPIKVGEVETLTGPSANTGKDNRDGFDLYLSSINYTVDGRKIEPIVVDDEFKPDVGLTKTKQLVEDDKVQVLAGYTNTSICYAVAPYVKQAQIPMMITANCGGEKLTIDPAMKSSYIMRFTNTTSMHIDPAADYAIKAGHRKAIIVTSDFASGIEVSDFFARTFIQDGGTIVQELHPALGTPDFGPLLAQLNPTADVLMTFLPGADGLHFAQQFATYVGSRKLQILDGTGQITAGANLAQLKDKAVGIISENIYSEAFDDPVNKAFLKAFHAKYPGRLVSQDVAQGYGGAQILVAALKKVNGDIENKQAFLKALYDTNVDTPKGPIKLDKNHDVVGNVFIFQIVKQGDGVGQKILKIYNDVSGTWGWPDDEISHFPFGSLKGKWVGMTKDKLPSLMK